MKCFARPAVLLLTLGALGGCGGGGGGGGASPTAYSVGGTMTGLNSTVVLRNNGGDDLTVSANGAFIFKTTLDGGRAYSVTVQAQPSSPAQDCVVANGSGSANANVTNVAVTCSALASAELQADAGVRSAMVRWTKPDSASTFDLYVSSARNCDIKNFASCPDGARFVNVTSPHTVSGLRNGQAHFFQIETVHANGARGLSNEAGARPNVLSFDGEVAAIAPATDGTGTVYLGGDFREVGITTGSAVPLDAATGRPVAPDFPMIEGDVFDVEPDGAGGWYLGGNFTRVGGVPRQNLAHVLANGALDPTVDLEFEGGGEVGVNALAVSGSTVYFSGDFGKVDGQTRVGLAAIGPGGALEKWAPIANHFVLALAVSGSTVFAGGFFTEIGGQQHNHLAAINADDGSVQHSWNPDVNGAVDALAISGGTIYVGGFFSKVNQLDRGRLAALTVDGTVLDSWKPAIKDGSVSALAVSGSTVYVGGEFLEVDGEERRYLAAIGVNGELLPWAPDVEAGIGEGVFALATSTSGSTVYIGGRFTHVDNEARKGLAAVDAGGDLLPWAPNVDRDVFALAVAGDTVYAGGEFAGIDSRTRRHLAAVDASGALLPWDPSATGRVTALAVSGSTVYVGGEFTHIGGVQRERLAAIDAGGTLLPWAPAANGSVQALAIPASGSTIYVGGEFTLINGKDQLRLAAIDALGTLQSWDPRAEGPVFALALSGTTVYAGGSFAKVSGLQRFSLVAIDAVDGPKPGVLQPWIPFVRGEVRALAVSDGTVYAGGEFSNLAHLGLNLVAIDAQGAVVPSWNPNANGPVLALRISGSTVHAGGNFTHVSSTTRNGLAAIGALGSNEDGSLLPWNPSVSSDDRVLALAVSGATVYVGGPFKSLGDVLRPNFGAVSAEGAGEVVP